MDLQMNVIYGLTEPNGGELRYVGKATSGTVRRLRQHLTPSAMARGSHRANWVRSLVMRGLKPEIFVIESCATKEDLNEAERHHIAQFRSLGCRLTNASGGGESGGDFIRTPAMRAKVSAANKGRVHTPEARAKMSRSRKGHSTSAATRAKISAANAGKPCPKGGTSNKGYRHTPDAIAKIRAAAAKQWGAPESRLKIVLGQRKAG